MKDRILIIIIRKIVFSDCDPEAPAIITATSINKTEINNIIKVIIREIIINAQKFFAEAAKNREGKNPRSVFASESKRPPVKKAFNINAVKQIKTNPPVR